MLKKIQIKGLFDKFDYDIELKEGGLTILTGPNGYGKTTILRMIHAFATKNTSFFFKFPFAEIVLIQEGVGAISLKKEKDTLTAQRENKEVSSIREKELKNAKHVLYKEFISDSVDTHLISEQRLTKKTTVTEEGMTWSGTRTKHTQDRLSSTVEKYAGELLNDIKDLLAKASKIGQKLDGSFPERLFDQDKSISEQEFDRRYNLIKKKRESLSLYGLSTIKEERHTYFKPENAKALLVYLNDTEEKLAVFDDILQRLDLFSSILNKRQFVSKQIEISPEFGFRFKTEDGKELPLTALSSGEQQEVVLLYELLFRVAPDTLVLIDEPEISLHVAWQMEFLDDLLEIIELQKITVLVATHSIDIIDKHEDLIVDLWDLDTGFERSPA
uniref:Predicted ATP-binding protein involved in virulence n=1 Tax=Candidatus Kentrum sp. UNK TaxID=2126344 RepID=A0A451AVJ0_9GAMM|nr:MAG: Predicted ATP-binding protein involved in virulence [Candidatus Kentron sp. UNK]VFK70066.1 MAG: Predicted ATP-binding protein involved in virulence [Candidatus Kentron sp. UNK]